MEKQLRSPLKVIESIRCSAHRGLKAMTCKNAHFDDLSDLKVVGVLSKHDSFRQKIIPYRSFLAVF